MFLMCQQHQQQYQPSSAQVCRVRLEKVQQRSVRSDAEAAQMQKMHLLKLPG